MLATALRAEGGFTSKEQKLMRSKVGKGIPGFHPKSLCSPTSYVLYLENNQFHVNYTFGR